jgi:sirohydrochlorin cobaltochelatase
MLNAIERTLEVALTCCRRIGEIAIRKLDDGRFTLSHCDDGESDNLKPFHNAEDAIELSKFDDTGSYRPLKTAPNLRHGWRLELATLDELSCALDHFYPARLDVFAAWKSGQLRTTPLRETLDRQSGMYRVAAKISDEQIDNVVGNFCRSDGGCLRTILWRRDQRGTIASTKLPEEKFDPANDQTKAPGGPGLTPPATPTIPLLCQEPCNLLVAECRKVVKGESAASDATPNAFGAATAEK